MTEAHENALSFIPFDLLLMFFCLHRKVLYKEDKLFKDHGISVDSIAVSVFVFLNQKQIQMTI